MLKEHPQKTLDEYRVGQLDALKHLEDYFLESQIMGRQYWKTDQVYQVIRSVRLTIQEKFK